MVMGETAVNVDPPRNPATGLIAALLRDILGNVSEIRRRIQTRDIEKTMHRTPMRTHLELHAEKWVVNPSAANTLALQVGAGRTVATVVVPANGSVTVDIPITIAGGQDVRVVDAATGVPVDGNAAVLVDSYLIGSIGGSDK